MFRILFIILKRKKYALIAVVNTLIIGALSYYLTVVNVYNKSIVIYAEMNGLVFTIISLALGAIISLLFGFYVALLFFRRDITRARATGNKAAGFSATAAGLIASGCPSCGIPLLGLIGFPLGLSFLPFQGLEVKVLSIFFLGLSIYLISNNIEKNLTCDRPK